MPFRRDLAVPNIHQTTFDELLEPDQSLAPSFQESLEPKPYVDINLQINRAFKEAEKQEKANEAGS